MKAYTYLVGILTLGLGIFSVGSTTANAKTSTKSTAGYAVTTKAVKAGQVTLPANTRVSFLYQTTKNGKRYGRVELSTMSYQIRHQSKAKYVTVRINGNFKTAKKSLIDTIPSMTKGKALTTQAKYLASPTIRVTTDGYIEYFSTGSLTAKPVSSTKITAIKTKQNLTHIYAKTNMPKLPDKHIKTSGNYRYRLAIRANDDSTTSLSASYSVGTASNYFYVPTLNA